MPSNKLAGDALTACEEIGSSAKTVEDAKDDPKVRHLRIEIFDVADVRTR